MLERVNPNASSDHLRLMRFSKKISRFLAAAGIEARTEVRYRKPSIWRKMQARTATCAMSMAAPHTHHLPQRHSSLGEGDVSHIYSILTDTFKERPAALQTTRRPEREWLLSLRKTLMSKVSGEDTYRRSAWYATRASDAPPNVPEDNWKTWLKKFKTIP